MYLIVGLGNPGLRYRNTRHNIGFDAVDALAAKYEVKVKKSECNALTGELFLNGEKLLLAKPQTFMNNSGESVRELVHKYKLEADQIIVVYDDMSLPLGRIRVREKGSDGGHNGIKSIIYQIQNDQFPRIKIGIGEAAYGDAVGHVIGKFSRDEVKLLTKTVVAVTECVQTIVQSGTKKAMNDYNGFVPEP